MSFLSLEIIWVLFSYMGWDKNGTFYVASELKALSVCSKIELFPPGHYWFSKNNAPTRWYNRDWVDYQKVKTIKQT